MEGMPPDNGYLPPPSSVQIKTAKMQKHLYCLVFTSRGYKKDMAQENPDKIGVFFVSGIRFREPKMFFDKRKRLPTLLCAGSRSWIFHYLS